MLVKNKYMLIGLLVWCNTYFGMEEVKKVPSTLAQFMGVELPKDVKAEIARKACWKQWYQTTELQHGGPVCAVCYSPDGTQLATGCEDNKARIFDVATWQSVRELQHGHQVCAVCYSPDGTRLVTGCEDNKVRIFEQYQCSLEQQLLKRMLQTWMCVAKPNKDITTELLLLSKVSEIFLLSNPELLEIWQSLPEGLAHQWWQNFSDQIQRLCIKMGDPTRITLK